MGSEPAAVDSMGVEVSRGGLLSGDASRLVGLLGLGFIELKATRALIPAGDMSREKAESSMAGSTGLGPSETGNGCCSTSMVSPLLGFRPIILAFFCFGGALGSFGLLWTPRGRPLFLGILGGRGTVLSLFLAPNGRPGPLRTGGVGEPSEEEFPCAIVVRRFDTGGEAVIIGSAAVGEATI